MKTKIARVKKLNKYSLLSFLLLLFLSLPAVVPLFHPGFFVSDDGDWMIIRFSAFHQALVKGQFPVRFLPRLNFEYGYPVADFLYPGFMYLAEPFHLLKIGFVNSVKIILGLSMIGSAVFMFLWLEVLDSRIRGNDENKSKSFSGVFPALLGAIVYLYAPYHLYDIYQRGSVGEVLALAVVPFILWSLERKSLVFSIIGIGLLILSHNTLAAVFFPVLIIYAFLCRDIKFTISTFLIGAGLATFFWLPALYDLRYTIFSQTKVSDYTQYFANGGLLGVSSLVILSLSIVCFIVHLLDSRIRGNDNDRVGNDNRRGENNKGVNMNDKSLKKIFCFFLTIGLLSLFFSSSLSNFLWHFLPISFIQFPFRLLSVTILAVAFLAAYVIAMLKNFPLKFLFSGIIILVLIFDVYPHLKKVQFTDKGEGFYATNEDTTTVKNEYMPKWVKILPSHRPNYLIDVQNGSVSNVENTIHSISFSTKTTHASLVIIHMIYFPGWQATVDNRPAKIMYHNPGGLIVVAVPKGVHQVRVWFGETAIRLLSDGVSLLSLLVLGTIVFLIKQGRV